MFKAYRAAALSLAAALILAVAPSVGQASTTVRVSLWDKGADMEMPTGLIYGTPGIDLSNATMGIKASPALRPPASSPSR